MLAILVSPVPALAWGAEGHEIVADIALHALNPAARTQVAQLLGSDAMLIHDSNWADEVRDQRPETRRWHFVDIPLNAPGYDAQRDCDDGDCVVAQIARDTHMLADRKQPPALRAEALRFLVHFVADVHQPLHAEDNDDHGGNGVRAYLRGQRTNLHHIWDVTMVEALGLDADAIAAGIVDGISPARRKAWEAGTPANWADESHAVARDAIYPFVNGRTLRVPAGSMDAQGNLTRMQLARAGLRLAWLLNTALN